MKVGWKWKKLGEVCATSSGGTPLKSQKDYYEGGTVPWLLSGEVSQGEIFESKHFITEKGLRNSSAKLFPKNTVLIAMYGATAGEVGILRFAAATNQAICGVLPNLETLPEYLYYYFLNKKEELVAQAVGGAQPNISQIKIRNTFIPLIHITEQQQIVSILDQAFSAIAKAKANAERNQQNAKELFESYLHGVFGKLSAGWEEKSVEACVNEGILFKPLDGNHGEIHPHKSDFLSSGIPFIMSRDMKEGLIDEVNCNFISESQAIGLRTGFALNGDVLLSHKGTIGSIAILETTNKFVVLTPQITYYRIQDQDRLYNRFLYYYFLSPGFQKELNDIAQGGSTRAYIGITRQLSLKLVVAPIEQQRLIVQRLDTLSTETKKLESIYQQKIVALDELKKSILQKAFNGELKTS